MDAIRDLAAVFGKRGLDGTATIADNLVELGEIWPPEHTTEQGVELLRIVAGGCGRTAFAAAAELTDAKHGNYHTAAVLLGLAERAYQLAVQQIKERSATETPDPARLPGTQFAVARMRATLAAMSALLTRCVATRADGTLPRYYLAAEAEHVVSTAFELIGADTEAGTRIGQIWRDLKAAPPYSADLARELIGKATLGIDPNETPRWL